MKYQAVKISDKNQADLALLKKSIFATLFRVYFNKIIHIFALSKHPYLQRQFRGCESKNTGSIHNLLKQKEKAVSWGLSALEFNKKNEHDGADRYI